MDSISQSIFNVHSLPVKTVVLKKPGLMNEQLNLISAIQNHGTRNRRFYYQGLIVVFYFFQQPAISDRLMRMYKISQFLL